MTQLIPGRRQTEAEINQMFIERWSPRAFSEAPIPSSIIKCLFEAARWAPSRSNEQPWLFMYAVSPEDRNRFASALAERNRIWASRAPILIFIFAAKHLLNSEKSNAHAWFDSGAAWMSLALEARKHGLYSHGMAGFSREKAYAVTGVPEATYDVIAAVAVGRMGDESTLPPDMAERELPNDRKPLGEIMMEGVFSLSKGKPV